jgi:uncharacterized membrane protein required for colicin V production
MLWDGLIVMLILALTAAGWSVGIVNSWRGPIALVVATLVTQQFYVDFATYVVQQLRVSPDQAVAIAYLLMWCAVEIIAELLLAVVLPFNKKSKPLFFERVAGAVLGLAKGFIIVLLPCVALQGPLENIPKPPEDKSALINPVESGIDKSALIKAFFNVGAAMKPALVKIVISDKTPSFKPNFEGHSVLDSDSGTSTTTGK